MNVLPAFYKDRTGVYTEQVRRLQAKGSLISFLRLISFIGWALCVYFLFKEYTTSVLVLGLAIFACYILLVAWAFRLKDRRALLEKLLFINTNEAGVLEHALNGFPDGQAFLSSESYFDDLDIFGKRSLFHVLNRTTTSHGTEQLAALLRQPFSSKAAIEETQQAIRVLAEQVDKRQLLTARGLFKEEKEGYLYSVLDWLQAPTRLLSKKWVLALRWIIVLYNCAALVVLVDSGNYRFLLIGVLAGWILTAFFGGYISEQHVLLGRKHAVLDQYLSILRVFNTMEAGNAPHLQQLQARTGKAHGAIKRLATLSNFFDQSLNPTVSFILNNLFLYNLQCMIALEKWKITNKTEFPGWIHAVGSIECLNSLAAFAFNNPANTYPIPVESKCLFIEAAQMAHPLIPASERVPNDFVAGKTDRLLLVTGSNMSGKTTFLRTAGVNLLLAQCGAPVCATAFSFTPMQILTSLRVSDSLQEHTSYFMAELKKLQQIIHRLQSGVPALVLIDEILRGTNSEDKTYGSEQFIRKLLQYNCLSLFATHDLSLGKLEAEKPDEIRNYCFESVIEQGELHFNYQLQRGIAMNRNASFLMKKMEII